MLAFSVAFQVQANAQLNASGAYDKLRTLVGVWQKEGGKESNLLISFELIANGSVLVETWLNKGKKHSFTLYHLDNERLIATHYCPQGNQPRLKLDSRSTTDNLSFTFLDATNLPSLAHSHQHTLGFEFSDDKNKIVRKESYLSAKGEDASVLSLVRRK